MRRETIFFLAVLLSVLVSSPGADGRQSQQATAAPQSADASASAPAQQLQAPTQTKAKPAKVWTNDDLNTLHAGRGVSVVGKNAPTGSASSSAKSPPWEKDPAWYRRQLQPLQAEISQLDGQIAKTKAFLSGDKIEDSAAPYRAYYGLPGNPQDQLKKLEAKRESDAEKLNDLLDLARHNNIEPGALR
jgi:hypothetical protein